MSRDNSLSAATLTPLVKVIVATTAAHAIIVMASLVVPVLAPLVAAASGVPSYLVGYYSASIYGVAAISSLATPGLLRRFGGIRLHQAMLATTMLAMLASIPPFPLALMTSAALLGLAYGPTNPAGTDMLARHAPADARGRVFSLKQTAVPLGGALAGFAAPALAASLGWRGAVALVAGVCLVLSVAIEGWRDELDRDRAPVSSGTTLRTPIRLVIATPALWPVSFAAFAFGAVQFSFSSVFPTVLNHAMWPVADAGLVLSAALAVSTVCRIVWGSLADRLGLRRALVAMGALMAAAAFASTGVSAAWPGLAIVALASLFGISAFCWAGVAFAETVRHVPAELVPEAAAAAVTFTFAGALAGPAVFSSVVAATGRYGPAFIALGVLAALATIVLLVAGIADARTVALEETPTRR